MTAKYIAYCTANAHIVGLSDTIDKARAQAREMSAGSDDFVIVFDGGSRASDIATPMNSHRLVDNLKGCAVVWRGTNDLAQRHFGGKAGE